MTTALPVSPDTLRAAFVDSPCGIGICDEGGKFVAISTSMAQMLRRPEADIVGRTYLRFVHPDDRGASLAAYFEAVVAAAAGVRRGSHAVRYLTGDGSVLHVVVSWTVTGRDECDEQYAVLYFTPQHDRN